MKKSLILIISLLFLIVAGGGCAIYMKECPPQDMVFFAVTPFGPVPIIMEKGYLNPDKEKKTWLGAEEFEKRMNQFQGPGEETQEPKTGI